MLLAKLIVTRYMWSTALLFDLAFEQIKRWTRLLPSSAAQHHDAYLALASEVQDLSTARAHPYKLVQRFIKILDRQDFQLGASGPHWLNWNDKFQLLALCEAVILAGENVVPSPSTEQHTYTICGFARPQLHVLAVTGEHSNMEVHTPDGYKFLREKCSQRYKAIIRIQAHFRGYSWRKNVLSNPHTEIGRRWLAAEAQRACEQVI